MDKSASAFQLFAAAALTPLSAIGLWATLGTTSQWYFFLWLCGVLVFAFFSFLSSLVFSKQQAGEGKEGFLQKTVALYLSLYGLLLTGVFLFGAISFWTAWAMPRTPFWFYALTLALLSSYGAFRGTQAVLRMGVLVFFLLLAMAILDTLFLVPQMEWQWIVADFSTKMPALWQENSAKIALFLLLPLPLLLLLFRKAPKKRKKLFLGAAVCGLYLLLVAARNVLLLGNLIPLDRYPILRTMKMIELGMGLSRMEYLGLFSLMAAILFGSMIILSLADRSLRKALPLSKRGSLIILTPLLVGLMLFLQYGKLDLFSATTSLCFAVLFLIAWMLATFFPGKA